MDISRSKNSLFLSGLERFTYIYIIAYILTMQMSPWGYFIEKLTLRPLTLYLGKLFNISIFDISNGSGDTTYDYFRILVLLFVSAVLFLIFLIKNRKLENTKLRVWTFTTLRYALAVYLFIYGLSKVFPLQFGNGLHAYTLTKTYGEASPMNLLWTFMGYSRPYTIFAGLSEVTAGLLLVFRKTTLLGALLSFGVMLNVFLLNLFYDVPVKLFSGHLLLFSLLFILYYSRSLFDFFILNKSPKSINLPSFNFTNNEIKFILFFKKLFVGFIILLCLASFLGLGNFVAKPHQKQTNIEGIHRILTYEKNKNLLSASEDSRWRKIIIYEDDGWMVEFENGKRKTDFITIDTFKNTIKDSSGMILNYTINNDTFTFEGEWRGDTLNMTSIRTNIDDLLLKKRKFHFVNERPFNH